MSQADGVVNDVLGTRDDELGQCVGGRINCVRRQARSSLSGRTDAEGSEGEGGQPRYLYQGGGGRWVAAPGTQQRHERIKRWCAGIVCCRWEQRWEVSGPWQKAGSMAAASWIGRPTWDVLSAVLDGDKGAMLLGPGLRLSVAPLLMRPLVPQARSSSASKT